MKQIFTDAVSDVLNTTHQQQIKDKTAFDLGLGDASSLLNAGLMAKSNAAASTLETLVKRKEKDKSFRDLVHQHMLDALNAINEELDWLDEQIRVESEVIAKTTQMIDFIQTLDVDTIMGPDGNPRDDVRALMSEHGYTDIDDLNGVELMMILEEIEISLHDDNTARQERIEDYEDRHGDLRDRARQIEQQTGAYMTPEISKGFDEAGNRRPPEVNARVAIESTSVEATYSGVQRVADEQRVEPETSSFTFPSV